MKTIIQRYQRLSVLLSIKEKEADANDLITIGHINNIRNRLIDAGKFIGHVTNDPTQQENIKRNFNKSFDEFEIEINELNK